jgi:hypothetical protein|tara:strand:+ start:37 stop:420 length:384 start_codon:yes stop_codon:yes gene_type:complete
MNKEEQVLKTLNPDFGQLRLTSTMLNKAIIDANTSIRRFAKLFGIDFEQMVNGDKKILNAFYEDGTSCKLSFYRTIARADRRLSISGIKKHAQEKDLIAFDYVADAITGELAIVVNVTARAENRKVA